MTTFAQIMAVFLQCADVYGLTPVPLDHCMATTHRDSEQWGYWDLYCQKQAGFIHPFRTQCFLIWYFSLSVLSHTATSETPFNVLIWGWPCAVHSSAMPHFFPQRSGGAKLHCAAMEICRHVPMQLNSLFSLSTHHSNVISLFVKMPENNIFCEISKGNSDYWSNPKLMCHSCVKYSEENYHYFLWDFPGLNNPLHSLLRLVREHCASDKGEMSTGCVSRHFDKNIEKF